MSMGIEKVKKEYYASGATKRVFTTVDEVLQGPAVEYYESGAVRKKMDYTAGKVEGVTQEFFESGELRLEAVCRQGQFHGLVKSYYRNGQVQSELPYVNGRMNGTAKIFYSSGVLKKEGKFKDGKAAGSAKIFQDNGTFKKRGDFFADDDSRDDVVYEKGVKAERLSSAKLAMQFAGLVAVIGIIAYVFDPNSPFFKNTAPEEVSSQLKSAAPKKRDSMLPPRNPPNGITKTFYPSGELYAEWSYSGGKQDGVTRIYHKNGKLQSEMSYKQGVLDGISAVYAENGRRISRNEYQNGLPVYDRKPEEKESVANRVYIPQNNPDGEDVFEET